ncbi:TetR/AcrR family transcriptional regulator C-terminal domain-containing protein [Vagococcus sp. BWB3-3]|uniref:TetR/AcrR family transcriptional regulator C-terminal domain-containing protein n=1 Tax=Vagococcus allomyrinae TaxID=2794353 RepID=A0A940P724_9ENTE|nr:TetR/AcrR family transcriptional regulator C-terminal domain-containing protein [Vagococcus allomyrinae]MBP1042844.1 TetR/AcrR family transcriptional regulator C-terminal domain-containing protein [Vagococcus allomyrinae]
MNTVNNQRRKASIKKIETAFLQLLQVTDMTKISVTAICQLAGINRSTFYANYLDIYDLRDCIKESLETNYLSLYDEEVVKQTQGDVFLRLCQHIKENQTLYRTYFKLGLEKTIEIAEYDNQKVLSYEGGALADYHAAFFRAGITAILKLWLENDCRESAEEVFELIKSKHL